jgi:hippurate hydrolase
VEVRPVIKERFALLKKVRRDLHKNPELSGAEYETQRYIRAFLSERGIEGRNIETGVVAEIKGSNRNRTIAFRADIDALNIKERTGLEFSSANGNMHACGHDGHAAMLLTLCDILSADPPPVNVRAVFQFGEEGAGGAAAMIERGAIDGVSEIYALHLDPSLSVGSLASKSGPLMAGAEEFTVFFSGVPAHCAEPEKGKNALLPLCGLISNIRGLKKDSGDVLFHVGKVTGGDARNVIAAHAAAECTLRYFDPKNSDEFFARLDGLLGRLDKKYGTAHGIQKFASYPPVCCTETGFNNVKRAVPEILSAPPRFMAEDFAFYLKRVDGCFVWLGTKDDRFYCPLHSDKFGFSEEALVYGIEFYLRLLDAEGR